MTPLTARQAEILACMYRHEADTGRPPTYREIMADTGITSPNGVRCHVKALERKGYLRVHRGLSRGLELLDGLRVMQAAAKRCTPEEVERFIKLYRRERNGRAKGNPGS